MVATLSVLLHYVFSLLYGLFLTASFAGVVFGRRNILGLGTLAVVLLALTGGAALLWGADSAYRLYPLLVHLPLTLFLVFFCKCAPLMSIASTLSAYLCCQLPRWCSKVSAGAFGGNLYIEAVSHVLAVALFTWFFLRYAAKPVNEMMRSSRRSMITYAMVSLIYYVFDYVTTVYTDLLYSGNWYVVQFMPSVISIFYFLFVIAYQKETLAQMEAQRERDLLGGQLHRSTVEITALRKSQQDAAAYRHDLRHHLNLLQEYARQGDLAHIQNYLIQASADLDRITPLRFCSNEAVNLILSHYTTLAEHRHIQLECSIQLPEALPIPETQLCVLLSNALENAVNAVENLPENARVIQVTLRLYRNNLLISIENPIHDPVILVDGLPQSTRPNHGYGTRSIAAIVKNNNGQLLFTTENGAFRMQAAIPAKTPSEEYR